MQYGGIQNEPVLESCVLASRASLRGGYVSTLAAVAHRKLGIALLALLARCKRSLVSKARLPYQQTMCADIMDGASLPAHVWPASGSLRLPRTSTLRLPLCPSLC